MEDATLLHELRPVLGSLLDRHLASSKEWFPHELVPWSRGRDFGPEDWDPEEFPLPDAVRSALVVNLLTEDNLPYYFATIDKMFDHEAFAVWTRRWTAEEMRHGTVIRDYLMVTRAVEPKSLERDRMAQVSSGESPEPTTVPDALVYLCLQELATRIAHRNTGKVVPDSAAYEIMSKVAADENRHYLFYRDLTAAALKIDPSGMMAAIERQVREFAMPGTGIPHFTAHAIAIAKAGIYNLPIFHDQILVPVVLRHWRVEETAELSPDAEQARQRLVDHIGRVGKMARRQAQRYADREGESSAAEKPVATVGSTA
jgi:acyl-[acyl-carrier-protein] desaturase